MNEFSREEIDTIYRVIAARRDMRNFLSDPVNSEVLARLLVAAHLAPSVGFMQPWRFVRVTDRALRRAVHALVEEERVRMGEVLCEHRDEFMRLKVEGILECGEVLVAALAEKREKHVFGRRAMPEMDLASVACVIQNMWLAARAEGIGMGWVSLFDPEALRTPMRMPEGGRPVAVLCPGQVREFYPRPMLEMENWAQRADLDKMVYADYWDGRTTPEKPA